MLTCDTAANKKAFMLSIWLRLGCIPFILFAPTATSHTTLHSTCESPSLPAGQIHVVVGGYEEKNCFTRYLWNLGLSNAYVYVYRRLAAERPLRHWHGPCGMVVHERLLLPNRGREASAFYDYVLEHYQNPPLAVVFLHGHGPWAYHTDCPTITGRTRLFYRGLVSPSGGVAEFSQHMVSLTRPAQHDDPTWMQITGDPASDEKESLEGKLARSDRQSTYHTTLANCKAMFTKWSVNYTGAGYWSCCAMFIVPWDRIRWYPKGFYREAFLLSLEEEGEYPRSQECWELVIYAWYQEPPLSATMTELYGMASQVAAEHDHTTCSGSEPVTEC